MATDTSLQPRPARISVRSPPKEWPITAGRCFSSRMRPSTWSATCCTDLLGEHLGVTVGLVDRVRVVGPAGGDGREAGGLEVLGPPVPAARAAATGRARTRSASCPTRSRSRPARLRTPSVRSWAAVSQPTRSRHTPSGADVTQSIADGDDGVRAVRSTVKPNTSLRAVVPDDVESASFGRGSRDVEFGIQDAVLLVEGPAMTSPPGSHHDRVARIDPLRRRQRRRTRRRVPGSSAGMSEPASEQPEPITKQRPSAAM